MDITLSNNAEWVIELLINVGAVALPTIIVWALVWLGGASMVASARKAWATVRNQIPPAFDQASDPIVLALSFALRAAGVKKATPERVSKVASDLVKYASDIIDKAFEDEPAPEKASKKNVGGAVH